MASKSEVLGRAPVCVRKDIPWERGRPARILIPANSLPSTATPLQGAPNPPLRGSLPTCRGLCGRDARAPRWSFFGRAVLRSTASMGQQAALPPPPDEKVVSVTTGARNRCSVLARLGRSRCAFCSGGVGAPLDGSVSEVRSAYIGAGSCLCSEGHPLGARASRPHPYSCKQPAIQGHSLARCTEPAFTGFSSLVPGFVRARRPRSQVDLVRARRPRSRVGLLTGCIASTA